MVDNVLVYAGEITDAFAWFVWAVVLMVLGLFCLWRSTQNDKLTDLRIVGAAMVLWVGTDLIGAAMPLVSDIIENILGSMGLWMDTSSISGSIGSAVGAVLFGIGAFGMVRVLTTVAGGVQQAPAVAAPQKQPIKKKATKTPPKQAQAAGGPPGAPGAPAPGGPPGPPGPPR